MARVYDFKFSGINIDGIDMFFEDELFDKLQSAIEELAIATGNMPNDADRGWLVGNFVVALGIDTRSGNSSKLVGLLPKAPINSDTKYQPTDI